MRLGHLLLNEAAVLRSMPLHVLPQPKLVSKLLQAWLQWPIANDLVLHIRTFFADAGHRAQGIFDSLLLDQTPNRKNAHRSIGASDALTKGELVRIQAHVKIADSFGSAAQLNDFLARI